MPLARWADRHPDIRHHRAAFAPPPCCAALLGLRGPVFDDSGLLHVMPLFTKTVEPDTPFKKNDVVKATMDLPGVPQGTVGKIKVINGFAWTRYWVFFENGIDLGQLDTNELVRPEHWEHFFEQKELAEERARLAAEAVANGAEVPVDDGGEAAAATDPNDPLARIRSLVPAHLLERSAAARARLGG